MEEKVKKQKCKIQVTSFKLKWPIYRHNNVCLLSFKYKYALKLLISYIYILQEKREKSTGI